MELGQALNQINEIHGHLDRSELYRGYRPVPVAISGLVAFAAAVGLPRFLGSSPALHAVASWLAIGCLSAAVCGAEIFLNYLREDAYSRRKTLRVIGQFVPCTAAGVAITIGFVRYAEASLGLLPGIWSILFALGVFASRPYLPRTIGWVALFYLAAGSGLLALPGSIPFWALGLVFGVGQLAAAWVLHRNLERGAHV